MNVFRIMSSLVVAAFLLAAFSLVRANHSTDAQPVSARLEAW